MPDYGYFSRFIHANALRFGLERNPDAFLIGRTRLGIHDPLGPSGGNWSYDHFPADVKLSETSRSQSVFLPEGHPFKEHLTIFRGGG